MRLLFIVPGFAADENDHNCIPPLQHLVRDLGRKGADIQIIALEYPYRSKPYRWYNASVWPCNGRNRAWLKVLTIFRALQRAHKLHEQDRFDYVHCFWFTMPADLGAKIADSWGVPYFITLMGQDASAGNSRVAKTGAELASRMVALSDFQKNIFQKISGHEPKHLIPWGIPDNEIPQVLLRERPIDLLGVGSLIEVKNWHRWLRVLRLVVDEEPDFQAVLIGGGPLVKQLVDASHALDLDKNLQFEGDTVRPDVLRWMASSKVLLHTSQYESFGYVFVEALANGCRVVSTPVGIAPELPECLCADTDEALAEAVLKQAALPLLEEPLVPFTMRDCGWAYWDLYHEGY